MSDEEVEESSGAKSKIIYGTFQCLSGQHDKNGNFKARYDSGLRVYEKRVPATDPRTTATWLQEALDSGELSVSP